MVTLRHPIPVLVIPNELDKRHSLITVLFLFRSLAHSREIPWVEYWDFLGCYIDLATPSGLEALEKYFSSKQSKIVSENVSPTLSKQETIINSFSTPASGKSDVSDVFLSDTEESPLNRTDRTVIADDTSPTFHQQRKTNLNTKYPLSPQTDIKSVSQGEDMVDKTESLALDFEKLIIGPDGKGDGNTPENAPANAGLSETPNLKTSIKSPDNDREEKDLILCKKNLFDELNKVKEVNLVDMRIQTHYFEKPSGEDQKMLFKEKDKLIDLQNMDPKLLQNTAVAKHIGISRTESPEDKLAEQIGRLQLDSTENKNHVSPDNEACLKKPSISSASLGKETELKLSQTSNILGSPEECNSLSLPDEWRDNQVEGGCSTTRQGMQKKMITFIKG